MRAEYGKISKHNTELVFVTPESIERVQYLIVKSKLTREEIPFTVVADAERKLAKLYAIEKPTEKQVEVRPTMILIDKNGVIRFKYVGMDPFDRPSIEILEETLKTVNGM